LLKAFLLTEYIEGVGARLSGQGAEHVGVERDVQQRQLLQRDEASALFQHFFKHYTAEFMVKFLQILSKMRDLRGCIIYMLIEITRTKWLIKTTVTIRQPSNRVS
jgi:hypothetical protein